VSEGQRFDIVYVQASAGDLVLLQCFDQRGFVDDRATTRVDEVGGLFHEVEVRRADHAPIAATQSQVNSDEVRRSKQLLSRYELDAELVAMRLRQVLTPRDDVHAESLADFRDLRSELAEADHA